MFTSIHANAALIATDWKTQSDSLVALDEDTGIEWLKLSQTDGLSIDQVTARLDGQFAGWRLPTRSEVIALMNNAFPEVFFDEISGRFTDASVSTNSMINFQNMLGKTGTHVSYGQYVNDEIEEKGGYKVLLAGAYYKYSSKSIYSHNSIALDTSYVNAQFGVYLVSDGGTTISSINNPELNIKNANAPINATSVPLPASGAMLGLSLMGLALRRKS